MRKFSLDELPQFINVLKGDLSLVGPRPLLEEEARYLDRRQRRRFRMRPGITGIWQVSGRSNTTAEERIKMDIDYVENWAFWTDFVILLKTIPAVFFAKGAK
ncbi:MAG: sugar transferase [Planctomycetes bacterium]|nr:sugar transferase [Planctomycetota bacterium]